MDTLGLFALATPTLACFFSGMDDFTWEQQHYEQGGESDKEQKRAKDGLGGHFFPGLHKFFLLIFFYEWGFLNETTVGVSRRLLVRKDKLWCCRNGKWVFRPSAFGS